jgi:hypothetical protein
MTTPVAWMGTPPPANSWAARVRKFPHWRCGTSTSAKAKAYAEEGRLVILELMGYLTSHYHYLAMGNHHIGVNGYE